MLLIEKVYNVVFWSSKNEEITLPQEFIFEFIRYFIGAILPKKSCQKWEVLSKDKRGGRWPYRWVACRRGVFKYYFELTLKLDDGVLKTFKEIVIFGILGLS